MSKAGYGRPRCGDEGAVVLAAALERNSNHPIARALSPWDRKSCAVTAFDERSARGVTGIVDGHTVSVRAADRDEGPHTMIAIEVDGFAAAEVAIAGTVRDEARSLVERWSAAGIEVWIASGDAAGAVGAVADAVGIEVERVLARQTPESKLELVQQLRAGFGGHSGPPSRGFGAQGRVVAMIGDGINDAAALREAAVGIAMFGGAQINAAAASVQLTRAGLSPVDELFAASRAAMRAVRRNLRLSAAYNALALAAASAGLVSPLVAAIAMPLSSVAVVASSLAQGVHTTPAATRSLRRTERSLTVLYFLVPLAVLLALAAVVAFRWAAADEQFDDLVSPAIRILEDDLPAPPRAGAGTIDERSSPTQHLPRPAGLAP